MARKQRLKGKWKQVGCSIVSVGILSCGAGYRTRHPSYLPFTGPAEVRIEQPKQRSNVFILEPLTLIEKEIQDKAGDESAINVQTNAIPPLKETHFSASSRPKLPLTHIVQPLPESKTIEELGREFLPNGFVDDLFDEPLLNDKTNLRVFLDFFQTNQVQGNATQPGPDPFPPQENPASTEDPSTETPTSTTP